MNSSDTNALDATAPEKTHPFDLAALIIAIVLPTIVTLIYFKWLSDYDPGVQQMAYWSGKTVQFVFPIVWVVLFHREKIRRTLRLTSSNSSNWWLAIGFGIFVVATMLIAYFGFIVGSPIATQLSEEVCSKVKDLGIDGWVKYIGLGVFYAIFHSFLEEYYWRWFVYDFLKKQTTIFMANLISSLGFMAHHVIVLSVFFGWDSPMTYLCSAGVAIGGAFWAWLYQRGGSLKFPWFSHLIVDAGIFGLGYFFVKAIY